MTGFEGLVKKTFQGNEQMAREYVADLGRAAYYYSMKPALSIRYLRPYQIWLPKLFVYEDGQISDINWTSPSMGKKYTT